MNGNQNDNNEYFQRRPYTWTETVLNGLAAILVLGPVFFIVIWGALL